MQVWEPPSSTKIIPIRPLTLGVVKDISEQMIPQGAFLTLRNVLVGDRGLFRRRGLIRFGLGNDSIPYRMQDLVTAWKTDGTKPLALLTDKSLYRYVPTSGPTEASWEYDTGTITVSGSSVTGSGTSFVLGDVKAGDLVRTADGEAEIDQVVDLDSLVIKNSTLVDGAGQSYSIHRSFGPSSNPFLDYVVTVKAAGTLYGGLVIADGKRPLIRWDVETGSLAYWTTKNRNMLSTSSFEYNTGTITIADTAITGSGTQFVTGGVQVGDILVANNGEEGVISEVTDLDSLVLEADTMTDGSGLSYAIYRPSVPFVPECVTFFMDRIWVGATTDSIDGTKKQRIRWSDLADTTDFSTATNYLDLPYVSGGIKRLVPMGDRLVAYFDDGIFVGIPTNYSSLPLRFEKIETGGIGLVSQKGVVPYIGGHFFVGQNGIYWLGYNAVSIEQIGNKIFDSVFDEVSEPSQIITSIDEKAKSIMFGFPKASKHIEEIWYFNTINKAWSSALLLTDMISNIKYLDSISWDGLSGTWDTLTYPTWDSFSSGLAVSDIIFANNNSLWKYSSDVPLDYESNSISMEIETGNIDFDAPETIKMSSRLSLKINRTGSTPAQLSFVVTGSTNKGQTWRNLGNLVVPVSKDEGKVDFRLTGSSFRFKLFAAAALEDYEIVEMSISVTGVGDELRH